MSLPPVAIFSPPGEFDVGALTTSASKALQVLLPWCRLRNSSELTLTGAITAQALAYVKAIDLSVVAAQNAFTVAEEAISLGNLIPTSTPDEHQSYLVGMMELAQDGHNSAAKTLQTFRDIRKDVLALLEKIKPGNETMIFEFSVYLNGRMTAKTKAFGALRSELRDGIRDLEEFTKHIDAFATWWNWMKMEASAQETRTQRILFNYDSLRLKIVIRKWEVLREQFADYTDQIGRIQDCYPTLFVESGNMTEKGKRDSLEQEKQDSELGEKRDPDSVRIAPMREPLEYDSLPSRPKSPDPLGLWSTRFWRNQYTPSARGTKLTGPVLMSEDVPPAEYLSATFTKAEDFGLRKSLLNLDFQCHSASGRRFTHMTISWYFKTTRCTTPVFPPKVVDVAPRRCVGGCTDEQRRTLLGLNVPVQFKPPGVSIGVEAKAELEVQKVIPHAMSMTGTIRGDPADYCVWTVKENGSSATGIPPHFRIAVVLEHGERFATMLDVRAKVEGGWWPKTFRFHTERVIDMGLLKGKLEGDPEWRKDITGEVPYADARFSSAIVA